MEISCQRDIFIVLSRSKIKFSTLEAAECCKFFRFYWIHKLLLIYMPILEEQKFGRSMAWKFIKNKLGRPSIIIAFTQNFSTKILFPANMKISESARIKCNWRMNLILAFNRYSNFIWRFALRFHSKKRNLSYKSSMKL